jgi:cobalt-zinc-cadmium efflux system membrane fusion protein
MKIWSLNIPIPPSSFWVVFLGGLLMSCSKELPPPPPAATPIVQGQQLRFPSGHAQLALLVARPASAATEVAVNLPARLVWNEERTQRIYPAFAGRVSAILVDAGQSVVPGKALARLASPDFGQAQADTARAQVDADLADKSLARQRELFAAGIAARKDLEQAQADAARARAEVARAQARTTLYGQAFRVDQQLALSASLRGVVVERNLNPGQELRPDQTGPGVPPLFVVTDPSTLWVQIDARESDVPSLQPGATFELHIPVYAGETFKGKVVSVSDFIDPNTRTIKVRGVVPNPGRKLKAEMLATARVRQLYRGVRIPATALLLHGNQHRLFVQIQPGVFESRDVELAYEGPQEVVVSQGLKAGEYVVVDNALLLERLFKASLEDARTPVASVTGAADADDDKAGQP